MACDVSKFLNDTGPLCDRWASCNYNDWKRETLRLVFISLWGRAIITFMFS